MVESGAIGSARIELSEQLESAFLHNWKRYVGSSLLFQPKVATPFWHMQNEPFYSLFLNSGEEISSKIKPYSKTKLREETFAIIDGDLFALMQLKESREEFKEILTNTYLKGLHSDLSR